MNTEPKPDKVLTCEICSAWKSRHGVPFMTEADLSRHRSIAHGKSTSVSLHKPSENIVTRVPAKKNIRQHTDRVPVKFCPQCGCNIEVVGAALSIFQ